MTSFDLDALNPCKTEWEAFSSYCPAPIYPGRWNSWLIIVSVEDPYIEANDLKEQVKALFGRDTGGRLFGGDAGGSFIERITNLEVITFFAKKLSPDGGFVDFEAVLKAQQKVSEKYQASSSPVLSADLQRQEGPCAVRPAGPFYTIVMVNFIYRGLQDQIAWLACKRIEFVIPIMPMPGIPGTTIDSVVFPCPEKPTFLLSEVMAPQSREPEPEDSLANELGNGIKKVASDVEEAVGDVVLSPEVGLPLLAVAGLAFLWLTR